LEAINCNCSQKINLSKNEKRKEAKKMLFMTIYTWEPSKRNEIIKRRAEIGRGIPKEIKVIGEWTDLSGGRGFLLYEAADPKVSMAATLAWSDLLKFEGIPVIETEEVMELVKKPSSPLPGVEMKL
jgi:hypothetical protein